MSFQPRQYLTPDPSELPATVRPLLEELATLRDRWRQAAERADQAREAVRSAPAEHARAVIEAAKRGDDPTTIEDPLPQLSKDLQTYDLAESGILELVRECWWRVWSAISEDFETVATYADKPALAATERLRKAHAEVAAAEEGLRHAMAVRSWVSSRMTLKSGDYVAVTRSGPVWRGEVTLDSLAQLHTAERKAKARAATEAANREIQAKRRAESEVEYERRKAAQAERRQRAGTPAAPRRLA
jgi:hypothetical protein